MLPLWSEPERLILGDNTLSLYRRGKTLDASLPFDSSGQIDFQALMATLPPGFTKLGGHKFTISMSNQWLRFLVLDWQPHIYAHKDWQSIAVNQFRERYGSRASNWNVHVTLQGYQQPVLAVAVDSQLVEGLDHLAEQNKWQLQSTEPAFASLVNRYPRHWRGNSWLLMAEQKHILLAESYNGVWQRINAMHTSPELIENHARMLVQQARQFSSNSEKLRVFLQQPQALLQPSFIEDVEVRPITADWLSASMGAVT